MSSKTSSASTATSSILASHAATNITAATVPRLAAHIAYAYLTLLFVAVLASVQVLPVYPHMMVTTVAIIFIGAQNSLPTHGTDAHTSSSSMSQLRGETMRTRDAAMFPIIGSIVLFSLYLTFKFLPKDYVNFVVKIYFFLFGIAVLTVKISSLLEATLPIQVVISLTKNIYSFKNPLSYIPDFNIPLPTIPPQLISIYTSIFGADTPSTTTTTTTTTTTASTSDPAIPDDHISFTLLDIFAFVLAIFIGIIYLLVNTWHTSNIFGIAFSIQGIELLSLGSTLNGAILLTGLFFYDIFWVFGTDVMVTVAKSFDAPIKLLFPQAFWETGTPSMLGLGDIVIPGIFIALMIRYDYARYTAKSLSATVSAAAAAVTGKNATATPAIPAVSGGSAHVHLRGHEASSTPTFPTPYFYTVLVSYFIGLTVTVGVMYWFKAAQPALLYLVPACLGSVFGLALIRGDVSDLWAFTEAPPTPTTTDATTPSADVTKSSTTTTSKTQVKKDL